MSSSSLVTVPQVMQHERRGTTEALPVATAGKRNSVSMMLPRISEKTKVLIKLGKKMAHFCRKCFFIGAWQKWRIFVLESRRLDMLEMNAKIKEAKAHYRENLMSKAYMSWCVEVGLETGVVRARKFRKVVLKKSALDVMFRKMEKGPKKLDLNKLKEQWELNKYLHPGFLHWQNLFRFRK